MELAILAMLTVVDTLFILLTIVSIAPASAEIREMSVLQMLRIVVM